MAIDEALSLLGVVRANCCHLELGESPRIAPVAQGIEHRFPKPCAKVRILPGAPQRKYQITVTRSERLDMGHLMVCRRRPRCVPQPSRSRIPIALSRDSRASASMAQSTCIA